MSGAARPAVFLDRDGVLNRVVVRAGHPRPPETLAQLEIPDDVPGALVSLSRAGFLLIGVTNQPDVARGTQRRDVVEAINAMLLARLPLTAMYVCYHDDGDHCDCRKPRPGLLLQAADRYRINLAASFLVGDRWKDVEAGRRAGCRTVLLGAGWDEPSYGLLADHASASLREAAEWIVRQVPRTEEDAR